MLFTILICYLTDLLSEIYMLFLRDKMFLYYNTNNLFQYP